jgi:hypothetical protein
LKSLTLDVDCIVHVLACYFALNKISVDFEKLVF